MFSLETSSKNNFRTNMTSIGEDNIQLSFLKPTHFKSFSWLECFPFKKKSNLKNLSHENWIVKMHTLTNNKNWIIKKKKCTFTKKTKIMSKLLSQWSRADITFFLQFQTAAHLTRMSELEYMHVRHVIRLRWFNKPPLSRVHYS